MQNTKDDWITVHPNGKEHKGQPLFVEEGESKADAIARKFSNSKNVKKTNKSTNSLEAEKLKTLLKSYSQTEQKKRLRELAKRGGTRGKAARELLKNEFQEEIKQEFSESAKLKREILKEYNQKQKILNSFREGKITGEEVKKQIPNLSPVVKKSLGIDKMQTTDEKIIDHNDYWYIKNNPLSKVGVFPYLGKTISSDLEPNNVYYVLRPEEELSKQAFLDSLKLQPFIDEHVMLGTKPGMELPEEKGIDGTIGADVYYKDGIVYGDIKLYTERIKDEIENGKKEISMGYFCDYEPQNGEYNGIPYQFIQKNLRVNHVALVNEGRMGADVRVMDNKITFDTIEEIRKMQKINSKPLASALDEDIEEITKTGDKCDTEDEDIDKRQLIDEIGGMLKDKVDEELWRTIVGKIEKIAYNNSEAENNDEAIEEKTEELKSEPVKDEVAPVEPQTIEEKVEEKEGGKTDVNVNVSMDEMIKEIGQRDSLVEAIRPLIGDNAKYKMMTTRQVAKYACDKLDLNVNNGQEVAVLRGYLAAAKKQNKVTYTLDNAITHSTKDVAFEKYLRGE